MGHTTETLSEALSRLAARGFDHDLAAVKGQLRDLVTDERFDPEALHVDEVVRFEGETDPDEQAVLFALRTPSHEALGTYVAVYGPAMPAEDVRVVRQLDTRH